MIKCRRCKSTTRHIIGINNRFECYGYTCPALKQKRPTDYYYWKIRKYIKNYNQEWLNPCNFGDIENFLRLAHDDLIKWEKEERFKKLFDKLPKCNHDREFILYQNRQFNIN